ncbi:MAG: flagellar motor protein MotA [Gemmatimonadetes bacterium]|jgi:biopolymer transport protein ExbB|uniref:MotA/TolQ/ExbB proton channel domain-containing protein n=1 Tax=marine metagenome TaxID=408172 RepID=A0A382R405_9ZZZZ|nr:flagellar motor protein MotA [Gemmatimonadota bacterium]MBI94189.1 flagellar motor protein MotA [Gemmatimonadaceae bacterium]MBU10376.1 flagellar motor protein MotA [Gemmatimonadota bacterium]MDP6981477.1 MotA/TolQ/ExbB proton channel family protein [Candidatus Latescibacterota bacterium]MDP7635016.1 MotA/TolQ/ExbB proton channel family protein [Candidatus Latescibacterota bacterium]|tara:strand:+ start:2285 stop:2911 length:627 start_codon:yes stop_codon:yes gene_type:complete
MLQLFNDGGWAMYPLAFLLIFGVAIAIERLINLSKAAIDAESFFQQLEEAMRSGGGAKAAAQLCSETRGPVASVIHAGLLRLHRGVDNVEKAIENAGAVEMAFLERGMVWLSTVANLAPMVGFLGTVSGMINAFQAIKIAGDVDPSMVAGGISEALITTAAGLVVGILIQFCYNFFVSRIDKIIADMQEHTAGFIDVLTEIELKGQES